MSGFLLELDRRWREMNNQSLRIGMALLLTMGAGLLACSSLGASETVQETEMQRVLGIGGLFFRSENPEQLARWYETHLGVSVVPTTYEEEPWHQEGGPTVFAPFKKDTTYFGNPEKTWMINFRVADLEAMVAQLREAGIAVGEIESYPNGVFARLEDPEGNPIELWQAKAPE